MALLFAVFTVPSGAAHASDFDDRPLTPSQQATVDRLEGIAKGFSISTDPAIRALYSVPPLEQRPDGTIGRERDVALAGLIDQSRGSTDPLVLDLLLWRCSMQGSTCNRLDLATRWTLSDTQNQVAWLMLASVQRQLGDIDGARATFVRAAQASLWHDHYNDVIRRTAKALPADLSSVDRASALTMIFAKGGVVVPFQAIQTVGAYCKEPGATRQACVRIVDTMVRDADEMMVLTVAVPYAIRAQVASSTVATYQQKADAMWYAALRLASIRPPTFDVDDLPSAQAVVRQLQVRIDLGELRTSQQYLLEEHVSEAEAAKRYVASLSAYQIKHRADLRAEQSKASTVE